MIQLSAPNGRKNSLLSLKTTIKPKDPIIGTKLEVTLFHRLYNYFGIRVGPFKEHTGDVLFP